MLYKVLQPIYMKRPSQADFRRIAREFLEERGIPNCIGPVDGKHIRMVAPEEGSLFYNYKGYHSIILMATCDVNYKFTMASVGAAGSESDGGVFSRSWFGKKLREGTLDIPPPEPLSGVNVSEEPFPFYFNGDAAFPLHPNIMRPYPMKHLTTAQMNANYRLSSGRISIEQAFGILTARWRILLTAINMQPLRAEKIVLGCIVLHNFLVEHYAESTRAEAEDVLDQEGTLDGLFTDTPISYRSSVQLRDILLNYFTFNGRN